MSRGAKWHQGRVTPGMPGVKLISCMKGCYGRRTCGGVIHPPPIKACNRKTNKIKPIEIIKRKPKKKKTKREEAVRGEKEN